MLPLYGSLPHQLQSSALPPQQNSMPSQPRMGMNNPQIPIPYGNNSNNYMDSGVAMPMLNIPGSMVTQPGFKNGPNHLLPLQNSLVGMPHFGTPGPTPQPGNSHLGFGPQSSVGNMNQVTTFHVRGQAFGQNNLPNLPQLHQNVGLQFGQFCLPNHPLQGMNQFVPMQMPNLSQFVPQNAFGVLSQASQPAVLQNASSNSQFGNVHHYNQIIQQINQNQHNMSLPVANQQFQANSPTTIANLIQTEQNSSLQPSVFMETQGNRTKTAGPGANVSCCNWKKPSRKNFTRDPKRGMMQEGFQNSQFPHVKNGKKKFGFPNAQKGRGLTSERSGKFGIANSMTGREQRRSLSLTYTEQEIQQWRQERRKNYPSKGNVEKKLAEKLLNKEAFEREAKTRLVQLKEILTKQAELGVEVAEIPGCYPSDPKKQGQGREENGRTFTRKGRSHNKFNKRGRNDNKGRYSKKQRLNEDGSLTVPPKKPTLLQKLLSADVKRDKSRLLQAFRFMIMNSFFKDWPDKPLRFPSVVVREGSEEDDNGVVGNICPNEGNGDLEHTEKTIPGRFDDDDDQSDDDNDVDDNNGEDDIKRSNKNNCNKQEDEEEEEEGEIIN